MNLKRVSLLGLPLLACALASCQNEQTKNDGQQADDQKGKNEKPSPAPAGKAAFTAPSDVAVFGDYLLVADCGYDAEVQPYPYKEGELIIVDRQTMKVVKRLKTSALNAQYITVAGDKAYVVSSGAITFDMTTYLMTAATDGAVDILDKNDIGKWAATIALPRSENGLLGSFGRLAISADGQKGFMGSGTANAIFELDLANNTITRGIDNPIQVRPDKDGMNGMSVVKRLDNSIYMLFFNDDVLCVSQNVSDHLSDAKCNTIGIDKDNMEGPIDIALDANNKDVLVAMSLANALYTVDGDTLETTDAKGQAGLSINALLREGDYVYGVNSGDNNVMRRQLATKKTDIPFVTFPASANPMQLAIDAGQKVMYISLFVDKSVMSANLEDGSQKGWVLE